MNHPKILLIGGGVRSGKSTFAVERGRMLGQRRAFIATATRSDSEMSARIDRHQVDRRGEFDTKEVPIALAEALETLDGYDVVVVDCVTLWLTNLLLQNLTTEAILSRVDQLVAVLQKRKAHTLLVTNEVGMSLHPPTPLGRAFVEVCGFTHQRLARAADEVHLAVLGTLLCIKPQPAALAASWGA